MNANKAPAYIQFYPTLDCNFSCRFCFNRNLPKISGITPENFERLAAACRTLGIGHIDILGGEPTLHPSLFQIVETIYKTGLKTTISSNGSNPDLLSTISNTFSAETVRIGISINDKPVSRDLHDYIFAHRPILKSVAAHSAAVPPSCRPYVELPGVEYFLLFMDIVEKGDLEGSISFETFHSALRHIKEQNPNVQGVFCGGFLPDTEAEPSLAATRCPAGTTKLSVLPDGSVYPCYLLFRDDTFRLGNILEDAFETIWHHPTLDFFRHFNGNTCPKIHCTLHDRCHGGCPAMAHLIRGRLDAPDPRCA